MHLHPTHFRFDQQDGNFSYTSAMRSFLEHVKDQTVPHDMLEELFAANVRFYDGPNPICMRVFSTSGLTHTSRLPDCPDSRSSMHSAFPDALFVREFRRGEVDTILRPQLQRAPHTFSLRSTLHAVFESRLQWR